MSITLYIFLFQTLIAGFLTFFIPMLILHMTQDLFVLNYSSICRKKWHIKVGQILAYQNELYCFFFQITFTLFHISHCCNLSNGRLLEFPLSWFEDNFSWKLYSMYYVRQCCITFKIIIIIIIHVMP